MSRSATSKTSLVSDKQSLITIPQPVEAVARLVYKSRDRLKRLSLVRKASAVPAKKSGKKLPVLYRNRNKNIVTAVHLLAHRYPSSYTPENYKNAITELQVVLKGIGIFLLLVYIGWAAIPEVNFLQGGSFVYNTGLIGGILMLVALIYSVFKRMRFLRRLVGKDTWYFLHIGAGASGAYLVILHSAFNLNSVNSSVAFITMLLIIISGALGRYLLTLSSILLHKQYAEIRDSEPELYEMIQRYDCNRASIIRRRLSMFALHCFRTPKDYKEYLRKWFTVVYYGVYFYVLSSRDLEKIITSIEILANLDGDNLKDLKKTQIRNLRRYILHIIKMGYNNLLENALRRWRVLHVPFLYILAVTSAVHVVAVHMY